MHDISKALTMLQTIGQISKQINSGPVYAVGGVPRDFVLGSSQVKDIDISGGDDLLALNVAHFFGTLPKKTFVGRWVIPIADAPKVDFSTQEINPNVLSEFDRELSPLEQEQYSRDFTINTLLIPLGDPGGLKVEDPTGRGLKDLRNGVLDTPVDPNITLQNDPRRILRAYQLRAKYGFQFSPRLASAIERNKSLLKNIPDFSARLSINKIIREDRNLARQLRREGFFDWLPVTTNLMQGL